LNFNNKKIVNMHSQILKYVPLSLLLICNACSESTIMESDHNSAIAVNAQIFQGDSVMNITVTQTYGLGDTLFYDDVTLDNIDLSLSTPDKGVVPGFSDSRSSSNEGLFIPLWEFNYYDFISGEEYMINAEKPGLEPITAQVIIPPKPVIVDIKYTPSTSTGSVVRDRFELTLSDDTDEDNYYYFRAQETIEESGFEFRRDFRFYSLPSNPIDQSFLEEVITSISDRDFNGKSEHTIILYGERIKKPQTSVEFQVFQITKEHYDFIQNYEKFNSNGPLEEPVNFNSNIAGGHGIFAITSKPDIVEL